ncbi:unnamed protein product [Boreogadus saida]
MVLLFLYSERYHSANDSSLSVRVACPSRASTGIYEALELRDGDKNRYKAKSAPAEEILDLSCSWRLNVCFFLTSGVLKAVGHINDTIAMHQSSLIGNQRGGAGETGHLMIEMDGTENKSKFGANAILGVLPGHMQSWCSREKASPCTAILADLAGTQSWSYQFLQAFNVINGGSMPYKSSMQEFMVLPVGSESFGCPAGGAELYQTLRGVNQETPLELFEVRPSRMPASFRQVVLVIGMDLVRVLFFNHRGKYYLDFSLSSQRRAPHQRAGAADIDMALSTTT